MGFFDFLPCCGRRKDDAPSETDPLVAPFREGSITSQDAYGAVSMSASTTMDGSHAPTGTLSASAKERIDKIGREVGGNMLSINTSSRSHLRMRPPSPTDSASSSRPPTPSPARDAGEGSVLSPAEDESSEAGDVVHKTLFAGGAPRGKKPKKAKGKSSRAKSKKQK
ncbi:hypothetical protein CC85DRAFT_327131 [Cutaneotrichosporon oleaginosum]|uniref:Uncharacterized protein n=1 Tax=Cutaneotrichosporon oleaginosum TaxID=879819 RepID=A0A0J0XRT7_9TREE|nr:uncharacterized protein CC85DRAFT_327131 [Cutaneotrichosporon oleaginosum]KLT43790.1 hypothetical protein CC85DRAFT_327131 [Cutaneotrichosporon oleaginosum]TXT05205.1 hypothetical protein COLE_06525 [Cutaneotrichosporon oleaginosum]